jgi:hypothetical protein
VAAVLRPLAGILAAAYGILANVYEFDGLAPNSSFENVLVYIGSNSLLSNSADVLLTLAVLAFLPGVLALYVDFADFHRKAR